ncbi:hypothetical protein DOM21_15250 [Bacteriovorax stolpii]|uniref:Uncharacterized protein n=1 Tax=Bacteriovorax stolpii TaxID=960 RepID=A0A2K9NP37_BACTC|nr:hypothetical protein [Bacteriovorax stolpii]AUN97281.1 hypothetical protein C0V70_03975 [Bacteriovorax stolpii]QDK42781.1 hypothetical protein DOM21_15250 [Bacteriovorax stolpii]TDP52451.1 hypothetical protein C8D79_2215 [Bacteriovorax stolpii]
MKPNSDLQKNIWISFFSLFTSMSTLVCCALPALLVSIGLGATMVGLVSAFPGLIWLSENKLLVFSSSFVMLAISSYMQYRARFLPCPIDPNEARACTSARQWSKRITIFSIVVWAIGATFALLPMIL